MIYYFYFYTMKKKLVLRSFVFTISSVIFGQSDFISTNSLNYTNSLVPNRNKDDDSIAFKHFIAHDKTQTCSADQHATFFDTQIRGVNLGGYFVLEPWITPSLFYQFLGKNEQETAVDIFTFCKVLGSEEGNRQLRRHWDTWITEEIIQNLASSGAVNSMRLPVGDWMFKPYGPYIGCTDGALDYLDNILDWALKYDITILIDIHAMKDSQNGFDNSGQASGFDWTTKLNTYPANDVTFQHWPIRTAAWIGTFDPVSATYSDINHENIQHALDVIGEIVDMYHDHPAILGLEPLNEPWQYTPISELKSFYWEGYKIVKEKAPYWKFIMHDSFRFETNIWGGFMAGCPDRALDTHIYQAWKDPASRVYFYNNACQFKDLIAEMEIAFGPVIVGEWSLATDNCAMWLNGFNDNLPGFPRLPCKYIACSDPYMGFDQPGTPVDPGKPIQGPFGTGMSGPIFGECPVDRDWIKESTGLESGTDWIRSPPEAPHGRDDTDEVMTNLARKKINAFSGYGHGFYFWNFRTDLYEPSWSYILALERGWIPKGTFEDPIITNACLKEDKGLYLCVAKRNELQTNVIERIELIRKQDSTLENWDNIISALNTTDDDEFYEKADKVLNDYWQKNKGVGATCDYGGIGQLIEVNKTYTGDDNVSAQSRDSSEQIIYFVSHVFLGLLVGGMVGICIVMRLNRRFHRRVAEAAFFRPVTQLKSFRNSFGGFVNKKEYMEIQTSDDDLHSSSGRRNHV